MDFQDGTASGTRTPVGTIPAAAELDRTGLEVPEEDIARLLSIDVERWKQEMGFRAEHLGGFENLPEAIREVHTRIDEELRAMTDRG